MDVTTTALTIALVMHSLWLMFGTILGHIYVERRVGGCLLDIIQIMVVFMIISLVLFPIVLQYIDGYLAI